ncbi:hypothetical protein GCM10023185_39690 [Hymenobacter saemangeumensis]|uniref:Uncharacterized protein n=1 Tax=Hymenobacter saemangeumensis TaxID=1084522 RepID=A0ABP8IQX1_9BACT
MADAVAASSPVSWWHLNLHGKSDFSYEALKDSFHFDMEALFSFQWEPQPARLFNLCTKLLTKATIGRKFPRAAKRLASACWQ